MWRRHNIRRMRPLRPERSRSHRAKAQAKDRRRNDPYPPNTLILEIDVQQAMIGGVWF